MDFEKPDRGHLLSDALLNSRLLIAIWPFYRRYVESLNLNGDERVLEFGSGTGAASRHLADILRKGNGHLTCVDTSEAMADIAKKRLRKYSNVEIKVGDIRTLDVKDCSHDAVFIHFTLHDVEESIRLDTVKVLARKLNTDGKLFIREPTERFKAMSVEAMREVLSAGGFKEHSYSLTKAPLFGPMYEAVYVKAAANS